MIAPVRIQEKGQVTLPSEVRRKLNLKKGDMVTFELTETGVEIRSLDKAADTMLDDLRQRLDRRGISLDKLLEQSLKKGVDESAQEFALMASERESLLKAFSLRAQAALNRIRDEAEKNGKAGLSDEEIDAEVQAARREKNHADRP